MKRPSLPRPSPKVLEDVAVTGSFVAGAVVCAIALAMIYAPAGLLLLGLELMAGGALVARRTG